MTTLEERLKALEDRAELLVDAVDLDTVWVIWCGILVFCECYWWGSSWRGGKDQKATL